MRDHYILDDEHNLIAADVRTWGEWFQNNDNRIVARTEVGDIVISTVCLGLDRNWGDGPPLLFETMIFGGDDDNACWRCSTWAEAEAQHARVVAAVQL